MFVLRRAPLTGSLIAALALVAQPAQAQNPPPTVVMPGETRDNIAAAGRVVQVQGNQFADFRSWAAVSFERADDLSQNMKLEARHPFRLFPVYGTAIAQGMLFVDFCVPAADAVSGCGSEPTTPEMITATLSFGYGLVGRVAAYGFTSQASFQATGSVVDLEEQRTINFQELKNVSVRGLSDIAIKDVPIPFPDIEDATIVRGINLTTILKRGRIYRFQLSAAATSTKGAFQYVNSGFFALADFSGPIPGLRSPVAGFVQLRNLTISVSPDVSSLLDILKSLQEQVTKLREQLDRFRADHEADVVALREELGALKLSTIGPGPDACITVQPAAGWVCVKGGWVPPDHPLARGGG